MASQCARCKDFDIDAIFARDDLEDWGDGAPVAEIDGLSRSCSRSRCSICRFLTQASSHFDSAIYSDIWHLRAHSLSTLRAAVTNGGSIPKDDMVLSLAPGPVLKSFPVEHINESDLIIPLRNVADLTPMQHLDDLVPFYACGGRQLDAQNLDYDLIKGWIDNCLRTHEAKCQSPVVDWNSNKPKVIDCFQRHVVVLPDRQSYLALSYCIGTIPARRASIRQAYAKKGQFPSCIADAIKCTLKLGYRYLWVDQYSINQNDPEEKREAIASMHRVYSGALATLVSLGSSQSEGLPGISSAGRQRQAVLKTQHHVYVSSMLSGASAVSKSKYVTRGWTYQESLLSQRLIIFSKYQVHFVCARSACSEAVMLNQNYDDRAWGLHYGMLRIHPLMSNTPTQSDWPFEGHLSLYTTREFTYESDILNAFQGVLRQSEHLTYYGVPFVFSSRRSFRENMLLSTPALDHRRGFAEDQRDSSLAFASGLSWSTTYNGDPDIYQYSYRVAGLRDDIFRRPGFPSWSWAACRTYGIPISYKVPGGFRAEQMSDRAADWGLIKEPVGFSIQFENEFGTMIALEDFERLFSEASNPEHTPAFLLVRSFLVTLRLCEVEDVETTDITKLCIRVDHLRQAESSLTDNNTSTIKAALAEYSLGELEDGRFVIDFDRPPTTQDKHYLTSLGKDILGIVLFQRNGDDEDEYCVMLIKDCGEYYERVGLVWIAPEHFDLLPQSRREIRLG